MYSCPLNLFASSLLSQGHVGIVRHLVDSGNFDEGMKKCPIFEKHLFNSFSPRKSQLVNVNLLQILIQYHSVWILPVYQHIFVAKKSLETFHHRVNMSKLCFVPLTTAKCRVRVLELEKEAHEEALQSRANRNILESHNDTAAHTSNTIDLLEPPLRLGTIDIIRCIKKMKGSKDASAIGIKWNEINAIDFHLHLVLGSDTFMDLMMGKWKDAAR